MAKIVHGSKHREEAGGNADWRQSWQRPVQTNVQRHLGKTMENVRKHVNIELVTDGTKAKKRIAKPKYSDIKLELITDIDVGTFSILLTYYLIFDYKFKDLYSIKSGGGRVEYI